MLSNFFPSPALASMRNLIPLLFAAACVAEPTAWLGGSNQKGGKATYEIKDGMLTGTAVAQTPNSFLCTNKTYGDFTLEYEFNVDPRLNSGVQIRSNAYDTETTFTDASGRVIKVPAGRVHGYQVEIDTDPTHQASRQWTAGIFDEGRRGWLFPGTLGGNKTAFSEQGLRLTKVSDWNHVRIEAVGPRIRTWLNGEGRADIFDGATRSGFIGFQVHSINKRELAGAQTRWRNVRLVEVAPNTLTKGEKDDGWVLLFDGTTTAGWRAYRGDAFPKKGWKVADGILSVLGQGGGDLVATHAPIGVFELTVEFRLSPGANSGIFYLLQPSTSDPLPGLEFQLLDDLRHADAGKGKNGNRTVGALYDLVAPGPVKAPAAVDTWHHALIRTSNDGKVVEHWLNGALIVRYDRTSEDFRSRRSASKFADPKYGADFGEWPKGAILLQDHGDRVDFRNIKLRELSAK